MNIIRWRAVVELRWEGCIKVDLMRFDPISSRERIPSSEPLQSDPIGSAGSNLVEMIQLYSMGKRWGKKRDKPAADLL